MRLTRALAVAGIATAALLGTTGTASAHTVDVQTGTTGTCPTGYGEWVQLDQTVVCVHIYIPQYTTTTTGVPCPTGYTEYSLFNTYRVCLDTTHN